MSTVDRGTQIDKYLLEEYIGRGAFGEVWLARHVEGGWPVAVKFPRTAEFAAVLAREGQLAARLKALRHPGICEIMDLSLTSTPAYIVYEYVDGEDLATRLKSGPMETDAVLAMARELLGGLAAAHEVGIIHRDIKPSNILFTADGRAKLTDFGIGKAVEERSYDPSMEEGQNASPIAGTVGYLAPEQMAGERATTASDVFSLAAVLYEALTCQRPWGAVRPSAIVADVPYPLDECIVSALEQSPSVRPSAPELTAALRVRGVEAPSQATAAGLGPVPGPVAAPPRQEGRPAAASSVLEVQSHLGNAGPQFEAGMTPEVLGWGGDGAAYPGRFVVNPLDGAEMVWVPAGRFTMGSTQQQIDALWKQNGWAEGWKQYTQSEQPAHEIEITDGFWLYRHDVTNGQYGLFLDATGHKADGQWSAYRDHSALPVNYVTWHDAMAYAKWSGGDLPSEAAWEYAARGPSGFLYPWGNEWERGQCSCAEYWSGGPLNDYDAWRAWYVSIGAEEQQGGGWSLSGEIIRAHMKPVGSFPLGASWCGALDMSGNVWEWCSDWYAEDYYGKSPQQNPDGPPSGQHRVVRGGSWGSHASICRSAFRNYAAPGLAWYDCGFRVSRSLR